MQDTYPMYPLSLHYSPPNNTSTLSRFYTCRMSDEFHVKTCETMNALDLKDIPWDMPTMISLKNLGSIFKPFLESMKPKYTNSFFIKVNFFKLINNFSCCKIFKTNLRCFRCFSLVLLYTKISSK